LKIDRALVAYLAGLSRLDLTEQEIVDLELELTRVLGLMETLAEIDVSQVLETSQVLDVRNVFRADEPGSSSDRDSLLANAAEQASGHFSVPKIIG